MQIQDMDVEPLARSIWAAGSLQAQHCNRCLLVSVTESDSEFLQLQHQLVLLAP